MSRSVAEKLSWPALADKQHVGEDRDGVAPLDDALHVSQGLQQRRRSIVSFILWSNP
jgi:hypothetical protein